MRILDLILKEFRQLRRDRRLLPIIFIMPLVQLVLFGYAVSTDVKHLKTVVCDQDRTPESRTLMQDLTGSEYFDEVGRLDQPDGVRQWLDSGRASIAIVIPWGYAGNLQQGHTAVVQALVDGTDANTGTVAVGYLGKIVQARGGKAFRTRLSRIGLAAAAQGGVNPSVQIWYNPGLESSRFMVPGVMCTVVAMVVLILTALSLVRERETGTMEQLIVTPVRPWELIVGKMAPYLVVGYGNIAVILAAAELIFRLPIRGSLWLLAGGSGLFLVASMATGLLISTTAQTQQQAMMVATFFILPNQLLSGFIFPLENMPPALRLMTYFMPMRYYLVTVRGIFLKGNGLAELWDQFIPLAVLAAGVLVVATLRFRKNLD